MDRPASDEVPATTPSPPAERQPTADAGEPVSPPERPTASVELLWDLVLSL